MAVELKVLAISHPEPWRWRVMAEIDADTIRSLTRKSDYGSTPPSPGTVIDIQPTLDRVDSLEERERDTRDLARLLQKLLPEPETTE